MGNETWLKKDDEEYWHRPTVSCLYYPRYFFTGATELSENTWCLIIDALCSC